MPAEASAAGGGAWQSKFELLGSSNSTTTSSINSKTFGPAKWKIFSESGGCVLKIVDTQNPSKSNWMRSARMARNKDEQNLVACQFDNDIYFYSIKNIVPNTELLFWFSREYSQKIQMPPTCEFWKNGKISNLKQQG